MKKSLSLWVRRAHYWGSIIIAAPLLIVISTGLLLQVKKQLSWVQPKSMRGRAGDPTLSFERILEIARATPKLSIKTWSDINRLDVRPAKGIIKIQCKNGWELQVDQGSGQVLQVAYRRSDLIESLHDGSFFHSFVKSGIFLPAAVTLLLLWGTGLYLFFLPYIVKYRRPKNAAS